MESTSTNHFVAYHNRNERGPYRTTNNRQSYFTTRKKFRKETLLGQRLWAFEGGGDPRQYRLVDAGVVKRVEPNTATGETRVYFERTARQRVVDVTNLAWFKKLLSSQQSFRNGLNRVLDPVVISELESLAFQPRGGPQRVGVPALLKEIPASELRRIADVLANSIEAAHDADPTKWGVRINKQSIMLKVGFVEVLHFGAGWFHFLVQQSLVSASLRTSERLGYSYKPYKNAPGCGFFDFNTSLLPSAYNQTRAAHEGAIKIAARSQRHTTTARNHSAALVEYISQLAGCPLPQPDYGEATRHARDFLIPEEFPAGQEFPEGAATQIFVNRYERDPAARRVCLNHYGYECAACGVSLADQYGPDLAGLIHVHHLNPVSKLGKNGKIDPIRDLRPVCPNCHAVIHWTVPPRTIEEIRERVKNSQSKLLRREGRRSTKQARPKLTIRR